MINIINDFKNPDIKKIFESPSASAFEKQFQVFLQSKFFKDSTIDSMLNLVYKYSSGKKEPLKLGLFTHADEISCYVKAVKTNSIIVNVFTSDIEAYIATPLYVQDINGNYNVFTPIFSKKSQKNNEDLEEFEAIPTNANSINNLKFIMAGMPVTIKTDVEILENKYIRSKSLDNRLNIYVVHKIIEYIKTNKLPIDVTYVNTSREEIGHGGINYFLNKNNLDTDINIVLDTTNGFNYHNSSKKNASINNNIMIGHGPVLTNSYFSTNQEQYRELFLYFDKYKTQSRFIEARNITDADAIFQNTGKCLLIQIPILGMHSPFELAYIDDIKTTIDLISHYIEYKTLNL